MRPTSLLFTLAALVACGNSSSDTAASQQGVTPPTPVAPPEPPAQPPSADEACAQVVVVAWQGAAHAAESVTRTKEEARARAEELLARVEGGANFADVAREASDAASSGPRGGLIGTYARAEWPAAHDAIRDAVFQLGTGQLSQVLEAPYGWVFAKRCPVEKIHTRHILVRYRGAKNAPDDVRRSKSEAQRLAMQIRSDVSQPGADFAAIARERSEDSSAERGGDMGEVGRGRFAQAYEDVAFNLQPGQISDAVETEFGFHVIQRVE